MDREALAGWLRLLLTPGVGNDTARRLLTAFGLPSGVWAQSSSAWQTVTNARTARAMQSIPDALEPAIDRLTAWLDESPAHQVLTLADAHYPAALLNTADPPLMLYLRGQPEVLDHPRKLAIVGSRNPTPQGEANARQFARSLGEAGVCVVSGLALGVDGAAHAGALEGGSTTIAVVGTGLDTVYPRRHDALASRIAERGLLISEYPLGTAPLAANFPQRNRIIAGLSQGTLVVEAAVRSGSLITARFAAEQGREVFAIPGSIHAPQSRGCHALIRQGAKLVESAQDILEDLRIAEPAGHRTEPGQAETPVDDLLHAVGHDPVSFDALQARTGLDTATLQARLLELELEGEVGRMPGGLLQRISRS
ncbi:DNA-processing protein DprA [Hydrogenophaga sp. A37]|uniref:DNA-processing protein DprA n=1 Tax=Hydrogenophaga sp. A37 TaxID=1945864 RepID=UPI00098644BA|nr:DNA-processing protein DprA [Hydrogenophaga sp. A37]OOG81444.1 DNA protecting protein DprA [Hydrogenophaga sp. A37]